MTQPNATPTANDHYNDVAIRTAARLHELRSKATPRQHDASVPRTAEQLFPAFKPTGLGVALEYERMGNSPVSADLQARADAFGFDLEHLGITIGTVIHNVDLKRPSSPELIRFIRDVLLERKVVCFRDQHLDQDQQVAFGREFGELDAFPFGKPGSNPYVVEISHDDQRPGTENLWHTDVTWMEQPSLGSIAQCVDVPPIGGDTLFADSHACYLGMPTGLKERIEHLDGIHDYRVFLAARGPVALEQSVIDEIKSAIPFGVSHPLLRTHPETGKTGLYLHGGFLRHESLRDRRTGETLPEAESVAIVRELLTQHGQPEYTCRFRWTAGSMVFWDNRAAQHYAASDYYPHQRLLRRVTVSGDRPFYDPSRAQSG